MSGSSWILQPPDHDVQLAPSWVSSFKTRNTFQILYSCIFTLILSAWTMLHPGIPSHAQRNAKWSGAKLLGQRLQLALVGLLLPEFMLLMAFLEYIRARQTRALFKELEERYPRPTHTCSSQGIQMDPKPKGAENTTGSDTEAGSGSKNSQNISRWKRLFQFFYPDKLERGYYACMGGFELHGDTAANPNDVFTLPPNVVAVLIALGITPEISSEEINDKSKAERFTKLIACLQALWMVIQVLTRKAVGLPITLLEFNAVMHIVCALVAYLAWFRKPKDINIPTPIKQGDAMGLSWQLRYLLVGVRDVHDTSKESFPPKFQRPNIILQYTRDEEGKLGGGQWRLSNAAINDTKDIWKPTEILGNELTPWQIGGISIVKSPSDQVSAETKPLMAVAQDEKPAVSTTESTVHTDAKNQVTEAISTLVDTVPASLPQEKIRTQEILIRFGNDMPVTYEWAQFVVNFCLDENQRVGPTQLTWANYCEVTKKSTVLAQPMGDWGWLFSPTEDNMERAIQNPMTIYSGVTWIFLSAVYGAIHLVPWNSYFPTLLERYMWRFSGITTICGAPVFFIISLLAIKLTKHSSTVPKIAFPSQLANLFNGNNLDGAAKFFFSLFLLLCLPVIIAWAFAFCIFFCVVAFGTIISLFGIVFLSLCARLYMIAEGFASLRSLPHAAYDNINWLDIYPHF